MTITQIIGFSFGAILIIILLLIATNPRFRDPSPFQYTIFRIILSLACACVAMIITGFLTVRMEVPAPVKATIDAGGALAVFVIVYFFAPAALPNLTRRVELHKIWRPRGRPLHALHTDPNEVNQEDAVLAIDAVNRTAEILEQQPDMKRELPSEYKKDLCSLYQRLSKGDIIIEYTGKKSNELLSEAAHRIAKLIC